MPDPVFILNVGTKVSHVYDATEFPNMRLHLFSTAPLRILIELLVNLNISDLKYFCKFSSLEYFSLETYLCFSD